jgi:hypothetical protein
LRNRDAKLPRGLRIDRQREFLGFIDGDAAQFRPLKNLADLVSDNAA